MDRKRKAGQLGAPENSGAGAAPKIASLLLVAMLQWAAVLVVGERQEVGGQAAPGTEYEGQVRERPTVSLHGR